MKLATTKEGKLRKFVSQQEVAQALGLNVKTLRAMIDRNELTAVIVAGKIRIPGEELERFLQRVRIGRPFNPERHPREVAEPRTERDGGIDHEF